MLWSITEAIKQFKEEIFLHNNGIIRTLPSSETRDFFSYNAREIQIAFSQILISAECVKEVL
jgi:hypothetical protein